MEELDLQEQITRITRMNVETEKLVEEARKLSYEGRKFERERTTLLITACAALAGTSAVLGGLVVNLIKH